MSFFDNILMVHINQSPLVITLLAAPDSNTGVFLVEGQKVASILSPVKDAVQDFFADN